MTWPDWYLFAATMILALVAFIVGIFGDWLKSLISKPDLKVEFKNVPPYCHRTKIVFGPDEFSTFYFGFYVYNSGRALAKSCEVVIEEVWSADNKGEYHRNDSFWPTNLHWEDGSQKTGINPKRRTFVAIGHISEPACQLKYEQSHWVGKDPSDLRLRFKMDLTTRHFAKIDSLPPGKHILKVAIISENSAPVQKEIKVCWSGNWKQTEEEMVGKEIVISVSDWHEPVKERDKLAVDSTQSKISNILLLKPLVLGILLFFFSVTLFGLEHTNITTKSVAIFSVAFSTIMLISIIIRKIVPIKFLSRVELFWIGLTKSTRARSLIQNSSMFLWCLIFIAYLLGHLIKMGDGLAKLQQSTFRAFLEYIGIAWFFVIFIVLLSAMPTDGKLEPRKRKAFLSVLIGSSLALSIYGAVLAYQSSELVGKLGGGFLIASAIALVWAFLQPEKWSSEL